MSDTKTYVPKHPIDLVVTDENPLVRVYNKSPRAFVHSFKGEIDGKQVDISYSANAGTYSLVPQALAEFWIFTRPTEILEAAEAQKQLAGAQTQLAALAEKQALLEKENAELKAAKPGSGAQKQADELKARIAELERENAALTEQLTAPAPKVGADQI